MKKLFFILTLISLTASKTLAQNTKVNFAVKMQGISGSILVPLGNFSETHFAGVGFQYAWYGKKPANRLVKKQSFVFTANGGIAVYAGKKEKIVTTTYSYPIFTIIHAYGGVAWRTSKRYQFIASAGPGIGIYNRNTAFNLGAKLDGQVFISKKISVGPSIQLMKEKGSDPLWAGSLGVHYFF